VYFGVLLNASQMDHDSQGQVKSLLV